VSRTGSQNWQCPAELYYWPSEISSMFKCGSPGFILHDRGLLLFFSLFYYVRLQHGRIYTYICVPTRILVTPERSAHAWPEDMANIFTLPHLTNTCGPSDVPFVTFPGAINLRGLSCTVITPHTREEGKTNLNVGMDGSLEDWARTLTC